MIEKLELHNITLVCQDWGGLIGLRLAAEHCDRFARIVAANTFLPTGDMPPGPAFLAWQQYSQTTPDFHVGGIVRGGCVTDLAPEIIAAYDAPFPDDRYKAGARQFPALVPTSPDDPASAPNRKAWDVLSRWQKPFLTAFSYMDAITGGADRILQEAIPGAKRQPHTTIAGAGHFLQEDKGEELARVVLDFIARALTTLHGSDRCRQRRFATNSVIRSPSSPWTTARPTRCRTRSSTRCTRAGTARSARPAPSS